MPQSLVLGRARRVPWSLVALSPVAVLTAVACSSSSGAAPPPVPADAPPTYVYQVTYKPGVVVVDEATVGASLEDMSDDGATFTFDANAKGIAQLQPGTVILIWGLALRKVVSVDAQGPKLVVTTDPAALTEAIQDGTIKWDQGIDFTTGGSGSFSVASAAGTGGPSAARRRWSLSPSPGLQGFKLSLKPGEEGVSGTIDGFDYKLTFKPTPGRLEVDAEFTKKNSGIELTISAKGFVNKFRTNAEIEIAGGETTSASINDSAMVGQVDLSFTAGKPTNADSSESVILKVPFSFKIPIPMPGGFPAFVQITANVAVTLALTGANASGAGNYVVPFHGSAGFALPAAATESTASGDMSSDPAIGNGTTTTSLGVSAMAVQVGFPHVGVGIGVSALQTMAYVSQVTSAIMKTPGELGALHCQAHTLTMSTQVGATATVFGLSFATPTKEVYAKQVDVTIPPGTNCN